MKIERNTNLDQLAERMGGDATREDAAVMLDLLLDDGRTETKDVSGDDWCHYLDIVAMLRTPEPTPVGPTPGPWQYDHEEGSTYALIFDQEGETVVLLNTVENTTAHNNLGANLRLISAAPELLAVLVELNESAEYWSEYDVPVGIVDRIRAAIAKATGGQS